MSCDYDYVIEDADLVKVGNFSNRIVHSIDTFVKTQIFKHINSKYLLCNLSDMWVLMANKYSDNYAENDQKKWKDLLSEEQYKHLVDDGYYVLGYILVKKDEDGFEYIDRIETFLRGFNLASRMMADWTSIHDKTIYPLEIIDESAGYWKKYYDLKTTKELDNLIKNNNILSSLRLQWAKLYDVLEHDQTEGIHGNYDYGF